MSQTNGESTPIRGRDSGPEKIRPTLRIIPRTGKEPKRPGDPLAAAAWDVYQENLHDPDYLQFREKTERGETVAEQHANSQAAWRDSHLRGVEKRYGIEAERASKIQAGQVAIEAESEEESTRDLKMTPSKYRKFARRSRNLTHGELRVLVTLLDIADSNFTNCFPGFRRLAKEAGLSSPRSLENFIPALDRKGWIKRIPMTSEDTGRFTSNGYQFCIPPDEITKGHPGWKGPKKFGNRSLRVREKDK